MMNPTVVSLQSDPFWSRRVPLFDTYVSRRLLTPAVFPLQRYAVSTIRSTLSFQDSYPFPLAKVYQHTSDLELEVSLTCHGRRMAPFPSKNNSDLANSSWRKYIDLLMKV